MICTTARAEPAAWLETLFGGAGVAGRGSSHSQAGRAFYGMGLHNLLVFLAPLSVFQDETFRGEFCSRKFHLSVWQQLELSTPKANALANGCPEIGNLLPNNRRQRRTCYALCHLLYPVSAAQTSIFRMDSNSISYEWLSTQWSTRVSLARNFELNVTKFAPNKALKLIA